MIEFTPKELEGIAKISGLVKQHSILTKKMSSGKLRLGKAKLTINKIQEDILIQNTQLLQVESQLNKLREELKKSMIPSNKIEIIPQPEQDYIQIGRDE